MQTPPLGAPNAVEFSNIELGASQIGSAGRQFQFAGNLVARIDGDPAGVFTVTGMETDRLGREPDAPPGSGFQWITLQTVDGAGPISMQGARALIVTVQCFFPVTFTSSSVTASVTLLAEGTDSPPIEQFAITATVDLTGKIHIDMLPSPGFDQGFFPGTTMDCAFIFKSTMGVDATGMFSCPPTDRTPFSASAMPVTVPARGQTEVHLPVTCAPGLIQPGFFDDVEFDFVSDNPAASSRALLRMQIIAVRSLWATSSIGTEVSVAPGILIPFQVTVNESGGLSPVTVFPAFPPGGVDLRVAEMTTLTGGTGGNNLSAIQNFTLIVKGGMPVGPLAAPISIGFSVGADATHPAQSGNLDIHINVLPPEEITFTDQVLTPSGTALGGTASLTIRSDGTYTFTTHLHDSGFDSYSFQVRAAFTTGSGIQLLAQRTGSVSGTIGSGSRDDDHTEDGQSQWLADNWPDAKTAKMTLTKSYQDTGIIGIGEQALSDLLSFVALEVVAGPVVAIVVVLGSELTQLTGVPILGPGSLPGVVVSAGIAWLLGPGMVFPALVAGVAAGLVTDELIKSRRMSGDERVFADQVFTGQVPYDQVWLTNMSNGGRAFTWPMPDGSILMNLGDAQPDPVHYAKPDSSYTDQGQLFIHEMTHAWQIAHTTFPFGLACERLKDPSYDYGPPGPPFSLFTIEGQASLVDDWYAGDRVGKPGRPAATGNEMDPADAYFGYIVNNIRTGAR